MKKLFYKNKILLILLLLIFINQNIKAENIIFYEFKDTSIINNYANKYLFPKNSFFIEFAGITNFYSINYTKSIFSKNNNNITGRVGASYMIYGMGNLKVFTLGINYKTFVNNKLILSPGINIISWNTVDYSMSNTSKENTYYFDTDINLTYFPKNVFFIKASFIIFFDNNYFIKKIQPYFGISIGFKFGKPTKN